MGDLRPSHLDDLGLPAALRWYAAKLEERSPLKVTVDITGPEQPIADAAKIATFRIVQEALNNVIRHAEARHSKIALDFADEGVHVTVSDDGSGFDLDRLHRNRSSARPPLGLAGMQERAALLGGAVTVHSSPGAGTMIEAYVPYRDELEDQHGNAAAPGR